MRFSLQFTTMTLKIRKNNNEERIAKDMCTLLKAYIRREVKTIKK